MLNQLAKQMNRDEGLRMNEPEKGSGRGGEGHQYYIHVHTMYWHITDIHVISASIMMHVQMYAYYVYLIIEFLIIIISCKISYLRCIVSSDKLSLLSLLEGGESQSQSLLNKVHIQTVDLLHMDNHNNKHITTLYKLATRKFSTFTLDNQFQVKGKLSQAKRQSHL